MNALSKFVNMEKIRHRYVIQYLHSNGLTVTKSKAELDSTLGKSAPSFTTMKYLVSEIKQGCTNIAVID